MRLLELDLDVVPGPALLVWADRSIIHVNEPAEQLFGYERGELVGVELERLFHADHREACRQLFETTLAEPTCRPGQQNECQGVTRDGREIDIEIGIGATADRQCAFVLLHDQTEVTRATAEQERVEQRLRIGALHTNDLVQYLNMEDDRLDWHGDLDSLLGYGPGEFPHTLTGWMELIHPDDTERIQAEFEKVLISEVKSWLLRYRLRAGDGSYRHLLDRGTFTRFADGLPVEGIGGIIDETEHVTARERLEAALAEVRELKDRLHADSVYLRSEVGEPFDEIIGSSDALANVLEQIESVAETDATVLLLGETGTGKELLARAIHRRSQRKERPLIKVDCGTLPEGLIESELFGHEKGSFTGAHQQKMGRFELAHEGTIFLDEIGELPPELQSKLLRVIELGEFQRLGGKSEKTVDVRVIAATNRDLRQEVREGRFRSDLFYRISVFPVEAPPLRERREDIPELVSFFVARYARTLGKSAPCVAQPSMDALVAYDWPGNVRELRNVIERSLILCTGDTLAVDPLLLGPEAPIQTSGGGVLKEDLQAVERARILHALEEAGWKIKGEGNAASRLGVTPSGLRSRMKKLGIKRPT